MISKEITLTRNGQSLGKISLPIFDTPDGNHGLLWKSRIFPFGVSDSEIDISTDQYFKPEECEACQHLGTDSGAPECEPRSEDQRTDEVTTLASRGVRLLDQLRLLVLEVMLEEPDCAPDGKGLSTALIEQKSGLDLRLPYHNSELTWSILSSMVEDGMVFSVPGDRIAWRLTRSARGAPDEGQPFEVPTGGPDAGLPTELHDVIRRFSEKTRRDDAGSCTDETAESEGGYGSESEAMSKDAPAGNMSGQNGSNSSPMVQCPSCDTEVKEFDRFCGSCASPL